MWLFRFIEMPAGSVDYGARCAQTATRRCIHSGPRISPNRTRRSEGQWSVPAWSQAGYPGAFNDNRCHQSVDHVQLSSPQRRCGKVSIASSTQETFCDDHCVSSGFQLQVHTPVRLSRRRGLRVQIGTTLLEFVKLVRLTASRLKDVHR